MKTIKILSIAALIMTMTACEEFQPVFTGKYENPEAYVPMTDEAMATMGEFKTISEIKDLYVANKRKPFTIDAEYIIKGQVTTSDKVGNFYKSLYIQDESAGIELKIGKNGLYNEFKLGQWVYVKCSGLTVGDYNGMIQLGYVRNTTTNEKGDSENVDDYETSYMEHQYLIDEHIFKGEYADPVAPVVIDEAGLKNKTNLGRLVTIKDLTYDNAAFLLVYVNPNLPTATKKDDTNRIFLDEEAGHNWGVNTWAMSESLFQSYLMNGNFDTGETNAADALGRQKVSDFAIYEEIDGEKVKVGYDIIPAAYSVSQYFKMGETSVQVRSSGYARFSDEKIDADVLAGTKKIDFTGILTEYKGAAQFTLIDLGGVKVHE